MRQMVCVTVFGSYSLRSTHPCVGRQEPFRDVQIVPKEGCTGCRPGARQGVCLGSADSQNLSGGVRWPAPLCTPTGGVPGVQSVPKAACVCTLLLGRLELTTTIGARPQAPYIKFRRFPQFRACAHLCTLLLGRFGLLCPHPCAPARLLASHTRMHVLRL